MLWLLFQTHPEGLTLAVPPGPKSEPPRRSWTAPCCLGGLPRAQALCDHDQLMEMRGPVTRGRTQPSFGRRGHRVRSRGIAFRAHPGVLMRLCLSPVCSPPTPVSPRPPQRKPCGHIAPRALIHRPRPPLRAPQRSTASARCKFVVSLTASCLVLPVPTHVARLSWLHLAGPPWLPLTCPPLAQPADQREDEGREGRERGMDGRGEAERRAASGQVPVMDPGEREDGEDRGSVEPGSQASVR